MKRNFYIVMAVLAAVLTACHKEPAFKVEGEVTGATDKML